MHRIAYLLIAATIVLSVPSLVGAQYVDVDMIDFMYGDTINYDRFDGGDNRVYGDEESRIIKWWHVVPKFTGTAHFTLEIVADDVDGYSDLGFAEFGPEEDEVSISYGSNFSELGLLTDQGFYTVTGFVEGSGGENLTTSVFAFDLDASLFESSNQLYVTITVPDGWEVEIESSFLTTQYTPIPIPGAVWLFGSGLMCVLGIARKLGRLQKK